MKKILDHNSIHGRQAQVTCYLSLLVIVLLLYLSCAKDGPPGPAGNTAIKEFVFDDVGIPAGINRTVNRDIDLPVAEFEKSFVSVYALQVLSGATTSWSLLPGSSPSNQIFAVRFFNSWEDKSKMRLEIKRTGYLSPSIGTESITFDRIRIVTIPRYLN